MSEDYNNTLEGGDESDDEGTSHLTPKCAKLENDTAITKVGEQIQLDEQLAREIESQLNQEFLQDHQNCDNLTMQERSHSQVEQEKGAEQSTSGQLRGSVPKNGPIDFASKNHFSLNSADGKGLVPKY